jgi:8-oxo-dGTP pyrophosphatase MutT (NUDIX family)
MESVISKVSDLKFASETISALVDAMRRGFDCPLLFKKAKSVGNSSASMFVFTRCEDGRLRLLVVVENRRVPCLNTPSGRVDEADIERDFRQYLDGCSSIDDICTTNVISFISKNRLMSSFTAAIRETYEETHYTLKAKRLMIFNAAIVGHSLTLFAIYDYDSELIKRKYVGGINKYFTSHDETLGVEFIRVSALLQCVIHCRKHGSLDSFIPSAIIGLPFRDSMTASVALCSRSSDNHNPYIVALSSLF